MRFSKEKGMGTTSVKSLLLSFHSFCLRVPVYFSSQPSEREHWARMTHVIMYTWVNSASLVLVFCTYAALSNSQGDFILNGDFVVSMFKREIKVGNAVIEYSGSDNAIERINSTDRIEQEITLQVKYMLCVCGKACQALLGWRQPAAKSVRLLRSVLLFSQVLSVGNLYNPDVRYTFNIPIEDKPQQFYWNAYGPWQPCSKLCQGRCSGNHYRVHLGSQQCLQILFHVLSWRLLHCGLVSLPAAVDR